MTTTYDPDLDFMVVRRVKRLHVCLTHQCNPRAIALGCSCTTELGFQRVPARFVEVPCRCCNGSGKVLEKRPASEGETP